MSPRIFIVGTGRSGSWILYHSLGCHPAVHTFQREMRFLIDPGGLRDLVDALTIRYHPVQAREALYAFERLMRVYLTVPQRAPYRGFELDKWLGAEHYGHQLDQFCDALSSGEFTGSPWQSEPENEGRLIALAGWLTSLKQKLQGSPVVPFRLNLPRTTLKIARYFPVRSELTRLAASFVDDLFMHVARENGKETWCEKTPQHLLAIDFIYELFPDSVVIHIKRDPRGVAQSLTKQFWAPDDLRGASIYLRGMLERWQNLSGKFDLSRHCYMELKLEDFAANPKQTLMKVASYCGLEYQFTSLPKIEPNKVNYWRETMNADEISLVNEVLGPQIEYMGYKI